MCGIAGFTHRGRRAAEGRIERITRALDHRGPDQWGVHESSDCSLGIARLRIIDIEGGKQPIYSAAGDTVIVFNGEIYNHDEVRRELVALGRSFASRSDTEVILQGFLEWDVKVFEKLRGMFGVALWTESRKRLVLARDRMGIKPLYLYRSGGDVYFGSELKSIFGHDEIPRRISREGLNAYLSLNYIPAPYTMIDGITKLAPGYWLEWVDGKEKTEAYWKLKFAPRGDIKIDAAKEELDHLLRESVKEHLIADVPLGVWASGGVDSSAILHYAAECAGRQVKTFSVSFQGRAFDESPWFREVAQKYNTDHHEFDLNPEQDLAAAVAKIPYFSDEPSADAGALPVWFLSQMTRKHVTVALSGEGADELFGGYYTYLADNYAGAMRYVPKPLRQAGRALAHLLPVSDDKISLEYKLKRFSTGALLDPLAAHLYWNGTFTAREREGLLRTFQPVHSPPNYSSFLELDQHWYLPDDILYKCDRMSMAHSLEVRPPFLDHRIVEFAARLPESMKVNGSKLKYILKETMRGKIPDSVLTRKKEGFDIPAHDWFRGILKPLLYDTLTPQAIRESGLFREGAVEKVLADHVARRANYGYHLWGLLMLFLWKKQWNAVTS
ncbi:MAG: asparagine synthase (glutamine-hydrolyzing) [Acidobacteria bacterium]|nr:asparagine synthase (glutamine-hydrolyzing) [Acidobacteriota bacterium]